MTSKNAPRKIKKLKVKKQTLRDLDVRSEKERALKGGATALNKYCVDKGQS